MIKKIWDYANELHMFAENDYVVVGVSGGADSVCLLYMLLEFRKKISFDIHVVHVNHGIRAEAGEDAAYVEALCQKYELPYTLVEKDVEAIARKEHISSEEAGRKVRYEAFYQVMEVNAKGRRGRIAIAHNKNDCCETFLFHLFRGSGLKGLTGIRPVREDIVRPLLCLERKEIEAYLQENHILFCIDRTNSEDNYTRNRIRHHILPTACEEVCDNAITHVKEACDRINDAYDLIEDMAKEGYDKCVIEKDSALLVRKEEFLKLHKTLKGYVLLKALEKMAGSRRDIERVHVAQLEALFNRQSGRKIELPYGMEALREYDGVCVRKAVAGEVSVSEEYVLGEQEKQRLKLGGTIEMEIPGMGTLEYRVFQKADMKNIPQKTYTKWLDYDRIKDNIVVRTRKAHDYLTINNQYQQKTLKAFFIDEKVPREDRNNIYLVTEGSHVIWVVGNRISSYYKVSEDTENIIQIVFRGGVEDG